MTLVATPTRLAAWLKANLPRGRELPEPTWRSRHKAILAIIALHVVGVAAFGFYQRVPLPLALGEPALIGALGLLAAWKGASRRFAGAIASLALVTASSVIVQFSGGYIEAHFHFFVVLAIIAMYQDYVPFLLAIAYVALDHGIIGTLFPALVYNHGDAYAHPWKWALIHAAMVLGESAALLTGWKISEQARDRADLVLASTTDGIVGLDTSGRVTFANAAAQRLLGGPAPALLGQPLRKLVASSWGTDAPGFEAGAQPSSGSAHVQGGRVVEWSSNPIHAEGRLSGAVVTLRDVTEKARSDEERERVLSTLSATLESTTDGILVIGSDRKIASFNAAFAQMWRLPPEVLSSRDDATALRFVLDQLADPEGFLAKVEALYAAPHESSFDVLELKDGRAFERYSQPQRLGDETIGRVWSFRDVTQRRRAEEALVANRVARPLVKRIVQSVFDQKQSSASVLQELGERIARDAEASDVDAFCRAYAQMGLGKLTLVSRNAGHYAFVGEGLLEKDEGSSATTCHVALGFLCGVVARTNGEALGAKGAEIQCESRGDACCRFIVHAKEVPAPLRG